MPTQGRSVFLSIVRALGREISGRLHFDIVPIGQVVIAEGEEWTIFRKLRYVTFDAPSAQAVVEARFRMPDSFEHNRWTSILAIPLFAGMPGFRSKIWMHNEKGEFRVVYEWQTYEDARRFAESPLVKMVHRRAKPGTLRLEVLELVTV